MAQMNMQKPTADQVKVGPAVPSFLEASPAIRVAPKGFKADFTDILVSS